MQMILLLFIYIMYTRSTSSIIRKYRTEMHITLEQEYLLTRTSYRCIWLQTVDVKSRVLQLIRKYPNPLDWFMVQLNGFPGDTAIRGNQNILSSFSSLHELLPCQVTVNLALFFQLLRNPSSCQSCWVK